MNAGWLPFGNFDVQFTNHHLRSLLHLSFFFFHCSTKRFNLYRKEIESRVERQHKDFGPHVDLARDGSSIPCLENHDTDGEPATELCRDKEGETRRYDHVLLMSIASRCFAGVADCTVDQCLSKTSLISHLSLNGEGRSRHHR